MSIFVASPSRMIEPSPNCLLIAAKANSRAFASPAPVDDFFDCHGKIEVVIRELPQRAKQRSALPLKRDGDITN